MNNQQLSAGGSHVLACGECSGSPHAAPTRIKWDETSSCGHGEPSTTGTWASQVAAFPSDADPGQGPASGLHGPTGSLFDPPFGGVPAFLFGRWMKPREVEWPVEVTQLASGGATGQLGGTVASQS